MTEAQTWKYCIQMWEWVVEQVKQGSDRCIGDLKQDWLREFWWSSNQDDLEHNCFFCDASYGSCKKCPGRKIHSNFSCCHPQYNYINKPEKFLAKIKRMDVERRRRNREKRQGI